MHANLTTPNGRTIAYHRTEGAGPGIVFLGGFKSDMAGTKAVYLEEWARAQGRAFLRFDYSGHGESSEAFEDGCIGDWAQDAMDAIGALTEGPQLLIGSSMGGWISLLVARAMPERVAGLIGIAAAPDFTEDGYWSEFTEDQRATLLRDGRIELPSEYSDEPYVITKRLIEDGRNQLVLRSPLSVPGPVRLLQGTEDEAVSRDTALRLLDHLGGGDVRLTLVKGEDHRFSSPQCLDLITKTAEALLA
ncbi:alpha/beta hydrolase [Actibacterium mucosum KCTC 23349]|uniref:Palmitoyl-protein thioesterase ABHD10, mitochondrial n=1 Tax=Actibacterium mucosum KCTC 23349 TaxID=1454373 RepID=A0A037ZDC6_9RHOB|nr:alpha/beta hydrolase [Actibacterium mucosum]KAJ54152.1 alpha/beta hydrolase [Actibacterium mucosum KCTC 23349]